ncbi:hypothetical protein CNAG_00729 [Cryptococcus neoformans var. grubii H99]|uniref:Helitron helicase-like domain-containing protein n=1 Tax=Cryptococcus neoformans (strain H99 / ATCC 208821 / CBS 10515 / FGSC 9487) TaxID=235443 RepID=J9VJS3_CRYN9|nr:hypothetical protein CNAG_00729 [Cryptococcus neoformans var. grubii H99]AFR92859.1 hypothetical protein CNAG_00729 [Cryptococcus neoformans var. grubii H99]AUB22337.1 hypothetical protein CKF44_00729 [Cryptococcus neoformans var. grubii]|eukprot:XP_012046917.1 hypothetical protein CNAG_00729 [Cryptococcus neoformans var. grubii H99]
MEQLYDFCFFECPGSFNTALHCGPLFQELILDAWAQVESGRLRFHESIRDNYRKDVWQGVADSAEQGLDTYEIGTRIILPSSFINGPRSFYALYQDAMAIIKLCGKPDIFLTFTWNGYWDEIVAELKEGQKAADIISRKVDGLCNVEAADVQFVNAPDSTTRTPQKGKHGTVLLSDLDFNSDDPTPLKDTKKSRIKWATIHM